MGDIGGQRALVTGASSGIGKAITFELARKRARVVMTSRRLDALQKAVQEIKDAFPEAPTPLAVGGDVTNRKDVRKVVDFCLMHYGGIDILVNNAGMGVYGEFGKTSYEDFLSMMEVNFLGPVSFILEVLPLMRKAGKGALSIFLPWRQSTGSLTSELTAPPRLLLQL